MEALIICARRVLELGGGPGYDAVAIAGTGAKVLCIEGSANMCEKARVHAGEAGVELEVLNSDITTLELPPARFQACLASTTLCHIPWEMHSVILHQVANALTADGFLVLSEPSYTQEECKGPPLHKQHQEQRSWEEWNQSLSRHFTLTSKSDFSINGTNFWCSVWQPIVSAAEKEQSDY